MKYLRCCRDKGCRVPTSLGDSSLNARSSPSLLRRFFSERFTLPRHHLIQTVPRNNPTIFSKHLAVSFTPRRISLSMVNTDLRSFGQSREFSCIQTINRTYWSCTGNIQFRFGCDRTGSSSPSFVPHIRCHEKLISGIRGGIRASPSKRRISSKYTNGCVEYYTLGDTIVGNGASFWFLVSS